MSLLDLADVAADQWGLLTTAQARSVGLSPQAVARLAGQGVLERLSHGVYRLTGTPVSPWEGLRAAWLALDPGRVASQRLRDRPPAVVSHRSAAALHQLGDVQADQHEFTVPARRQTRRTEITLYRGQLEAADWTLVEGLPVTTVLHTIDDLAAARLDGGHLAAIVRDALVTQHIDVDALVLVLRAHAHRYGAPLGDGEALLQRFLAEAGLPESTLRAAHLTQPTPDRTDFRDAITEQAAQLGQCGASPAFDRLARQIAVSLMHNPGVREAAARMAASVMAPSGPEEPPRAALAVREDESQVRTQADTENSGSAATGRMPSGSDAGEAAPAGRMGTEHAPGVDEPEEPRG